MVIVTSNSAIISGWNYCYLVLSTTLAFRAASLYWHIENLFTIALCVTVASVTGFYLFADFAAPHKLATTTTKQQQSSPTKCRVATRMAGMVLSGMCVGVWTFFVFDWSVGDFSDPEFLRLYSLAVYVCTAVAAAVVVLLSFLNSCCCFGHRLPGREDDDDDEDDTYYRRKAPTRSYADDFSRLCMVLCCLSTLVWVKIVAWHQGVPLAFSGLVACIVVVSFVRTVFRDGAPASRVVLSRDTESGESTGRVFTKCNMCVWLLKVLVFCAMTGTLAFVLFVWNVPTANNNARSLELVAYGTSVATTATALLGAIWLMIRCFSSRSSAFQKQAQ